MSDRTFVIVGGGLAGAKAAATLRSEGVDGRVVLVGEGARAAPRGGVRRRGVLVGGGAGAAVRAAAAVEGVPARRGGPREDLGRGGRLLRGERDRGPERRPRRGERRVREPGCRRRPRPDPIREDPAR